MPCKTWYKPQDRSCRKEEGYKHQPSDHHLPPAALWVWMEDFQLGKNRDDNIFYIADNYIHTVHTSIQQYEWSQTDVNKWITWANMNIDDVSLTGGDKDYAEPDHPGNGNLNPMSHSISWDPLIIITFCKWVLFYNCNSLFNVHAGGFVLFLVEWKTVFLKKIRQKGEGLCSFHVRFYLFWLLALFLFSWKMFFLLKKKSTINVGLIHYSETTLLNYIVFCKCSYIEYEC